MTEYEIKLLEIYRTLNKTQKKQVERALYLMVALERLNGGKYAGEIKSAACFGATTGLEQRYTASKAEIKHAVKRFRAIQGDKSQPEQARQDCERAISWMREHIFRAEN